MKYKLIIRRIDVQGVRPAAEDHAGRRRVRQRAVAVRRRIELRGIERGAVGDGRRVAPANRARGRIDEEGHLFAGGRVVRRGRRVDVQGVRPISAPIR